MPAASPSTRQLVRAANYIQKRYDRTLERWQNLSNIRLPYATFRRCRQQLRRFRQITRLSRFPHRQAGFQRGLQRSLDILYSEILAVRRAIGRMADEELERPVPPTMPLLYAELAALHTEFPAVQLDLQAGTLTVHTDPITLHDEYDDSADSVFVGAFAIVLNLRKLGGEHHPSYSIQALDRTLGRNGYAHPHVSSGDLCEGDGYHPIRGALAEGRLYDFFTVVRTVLETYNAESAYEGWNDTATCPVCDDSTSELSMCEHCSNEMCENCCVYCGDCGVRLCSDHQRDCAGCGTTRCDACLNSCAYCSERYCNECFTSAVCADCGRNLCRSCRDARACCVCGRRSCDHCGSYCSRCRGGLCQVCSDLDSCPGCDKNAEAEEADTSDAGVRSDGACAPVYTPSLGQTAVSS